MAEFAYNNANNEIISPIFFKLNCTFEEDINFCSRSNLTEKLAKARRQVILIYHQKSQKQAYDKSVTSHNYASNKKVCLNSKFIKTHWKYKLESKFFRLFQVLYPIGK